MLEAYVRRFPLSSYVQDALYWLGRSYERSGNTEHARNFYLADANRFPLTYFGAKAAERLRPEPEGIGASPVNPAEFPSGDSSRAARAVARSAGLPLRRKSGRPARARSAILLSIPPRNWNIAPPMLRLTRRNF